MWNVEEGKVLGFVLGVGCGRQEGGLRLLGNDDI